MAKSNGIKSLKQAAKLLNKHSPDGESLAYINPDEGRLLKAHGGSGIMTLQGVPTYGAIWDIAKKFIPDAWEPALETVGNLGKGVYDFLGYGDKEIPHPDQDKYPGKTITQPGRSIVQDAMSIWIGLRAKKEQEGLNEAEMAEFNRLNTQLTAAKTEFDVGSDFGTQLKAPTNVASTVSDVAAYSPIDFSGQDTPELITTPTAAEGGRIGAFNGGIQGLMPQQGMPQQGMPQQGMPQPGLMPPQGLNPRMGYAHGIGPQRKGSETIDMDMDMEWGGPEQIEWSSARERGMDKDPLFASRIMKLEGEHERDVAEHEGAALFDKAWDLVNRGIAENINHALQMLRGEMDQPIGAAHGGRIGYQEAGSVLSAQQIAQIKQMAGMGSDTSTISSITGATVDQINNVLNPPVDSQAHGGRIGAQGGGIMPLLDMGGMEKDYRQEGGFVPIGRREKADDVPARLSKNEFVFTADAVKAAGDGDIDEGAQRMYNVMKNLEAGGEISEQSQGQA